MRGYFMTLSFSIGDLRFGLTSLSPDLNDAFVRFYAARLTGEQVREAEFDSAAGAFLVGNADSGAHDQFFSNFTPLWKVYLDAGRLSDATGVWQWALRPALALESSSATRVHKGTAYYFWGMTVLLA